MRDFEEYAFRLPDDTLRYEMIDLNASLEEQIEAFMKMHSSTEAGPLSVMEEESR